MEYRAMKRIRLENLLIVAAFAAVLLGNGREPELSTPAVAGAVPAATVAAAVAPETRRWQIHGDSVSVFPAPAWMRREAQLASLRP
jgi:hypothetical protein